MNDALWIVIAAGVIANAFRSESASIDNHNRKFRLRLRENLLSAIVIFLAVFFLGSLLLDLDLIGPSLIALHLADASSRTAPYIAALFISALDLIARTLTNFYFCLIDDQVAARKNQSWKGGYSKTNTRTRTRTRTPGQTSIEDPAERQTAAESDPHT
jgi:hypothetical protein